MASLMALRRTRSPTFSAFFKVRTPHSSHFTFNHSQTLTPAKTLTTTAIPDAPQPSDHHHHSNWNSQDQQNPNQWVPQGQRYPQHSNPNHNPNLNPNQWNTQNQNYPQRGNPNQMNSYPSSRNPNQGQGYPQQGLNYPNQGQSYPQPGSPRLNNPNQSYNPAQGQRYSQQGSPNQWNTQNPSYPQNQNPSFVNNQNQNYQQPRNPSQWNTQTQGYPQRANPNQWTPQDQNPNQWSNQTPSQGPVARNHAPNAPPMSPTPPPPSVADLISLCQDGKVKEAIELMSQGVRADAQCFYALFNLCGNSKSLEDAKKVHDYFLRSTIRGDLQLNHKVIEMYDKCGSMVDARRVFDHMPERNMDSWHLMINGYANNGLGDDGLELFEQMRGLGLRPNEQTFLAVLSACASAEAVEEGFIHFESMKTEYGIAPGMEHYLGIIGVLGKSGHLTEAQEYIETMPVEPTAIVWEALMNYARIHGDIDLEDHAEELMVSLDPLKAVANKIPTPPPKKRSAINMLDGKNRLVEFRNPTLYKDDEKLKSLSGMKEAGYVPDTRYEAKVSENFVGPWPEPSLVPFYKGEILMGSLAKCDAIINPTKHYLWEQASVLLEAALTPLF
ncbi:hypothetical protein L1049_015474 [Liquidambar formosana]|uniref:Pentatricopeptide repeat-containing protein n=1 Tax=Liquidambar formosana TaxID=63359 RepID=A0AAP0X6K0_LIQFO